MKEIEEAVSNLRPDELAAFRAWLLEFDATAWDQQIERDIAAGRLDRFANEALEDLLRGSVNDRDTLR